MSFTPADLFTGGKAGAWYDPSDLSTLFQNSDGTGAVAVGDPVGYVQDKSGNGNHATQATAAARPVLRQNEDGFNYLDFDGVDDQLALPFAPLASHHLFLAANCPPSNNTFEAVFSSRDSTNTSYQIEANGNSVFRYAINSGLTLTGTVSDFSGQRVVFDLRWAGNGNLLETFMDGTAYQSGTITYALGGTEQYIGRNRSGVRFSPANMYGFIYSELTAQASDVRTWLTAKMSPSAGETGSGGSTAPAQTSSGTGTKVGVASGGSTAPAQTASGAGTRATDATGTGAVAAQTGSGAGLRIIPGTGGGTAPAQTSSGVILRTVNGTGAGTAPAQTGSGSVQPGSDATGGSTAPAQTASGAGLRAISATGDGTAPIQTATGVALRVITGGGASVAPAQTSAGLALRIGDSAGASTAPAQVGSGAGLREIVASGASTAPAQTSRGFNVLALPVPSWRTATVLAQDRSAAVAAQDRSAAVAAQDRSAIVIRPAA